MTIKISMDFSEIDKEAADIISRDIKTIFKTTNKTKQRA